MGSIREPQNQKYTLTNAENEHAKLEVHKAAIGRYSMHNPTLRGGYLSLQCVRDCQLESISEKITCLTEDSNIRFSIVT